MVELEPLFTATLNALPAIALPNKHSNGVRYSFSSRSGKLVEVHKCLHFASKLLKFLGSPDYFMLYPYGDFLLGDAIATFDSKHLTPICPAARPVECPQRAIVDLSGAQIALLWQPEAHRQDRTRVGPRSNVLNHCDLQSFVGGITHGPPLAISLRPPAR